MAITKDQIKSKKASIPKSTLLGRPNIKPSSEEINEKEAEKILQKQLEKQLLSKEENIQTNNSKIGANKSELRDIKYFGCYQLIKGKLTKESTINISVSIRFIEESLGVSKKTAKRYLKIFIDCGWIKLNQPFDSETSRPSSYDFLK